MGLASILGKISRGAVGAAEKAIPAVKTGVEKIATEAGESAQKVVGAGAREAEKIITTPVTKRIEEVGIKGLSSELDPNLTRTITNAGDDFISHLPAETQREVALSQATLMRSTNGQYYNDAAQYVDKVMETVGELSKPTGSRFMQAVKLVPKAIGEITINGMLGLKSAIVNVLSSATVPVIENIERNVVGRMVASAFGKSNGTITSGLQATGRYMSDYLQSIPYAFKMGLETLKTGKNYFNPRPIQKQETGSALMQLANLAPDNGFGRGAKKLLNFLNFPLALVKASDETTANLTGIPEILRQARVIGKDVLKLEGRAADEYAESTLTRILTAPVDELDSVEKQIRNGAHMSASHANFTELIEQGDKAGIEKLSDHLASTVIKTVNENPQSLGLVSVFMRSPYLAGKLGLQHTPLQAINKQFYRELSNPATRELAIGRVSLGAMFLGAGAGLVYSKLGYGDAPIDAAERKALEAAGVKFNSIGGFSLNKNFTLVAPLTMGMNLVSALQKYDLEEGDLLGVAQACSLVIGNALKDVNFAKDLATVASSILDNPAKASKILLNRGYNVLPFARDLKGIEEFAGLREANEIIDQLKARVPIWGNSVDFKRDVFGRKPDQTFFGVKSLGDSLSKSEPISRAIIDDKISIPDLPQTLTGSNRVINIRQAKGKSGESIWSEIKDLSGKIKLPQYKGKDLVGALNDLVKSSNYNKLSRDFVLGNDSRSPRDKVIQDVVNEYRDAATKAILRQYPSLRRAQAKIQQHQKAVKAGKSGSRIGGSIKDSLSNISKSGI